MIFSLIIKKEINVNHCKKDNKLIKRIMSKRKRDESDSSVSFDEEESVLKRQKQDPPFPSDSSSSSSSGDLSSYSSSSDYSNSSDNSDDSDSNSSDSDSSSLSVSIDEGGRGRGRGGEDDDLSPINGKNRPKWFRTGSDAIYITRVSSRNGESIKVNSFNKKREDYSKKISTIATGKSIRKVKKPFGSVNQELYDTSFTLLHKVCTYDGKLQYAIIQSEENYDLFMIDSQLFDFWFDDDCEKWYNNSTNREDKAQVESVDD